MERPPCAETVVLPDAVDNHYVVFACVFSEPRDEPRAVAISENSRSEGMDGERKVF